MSVWIILNIAAARGHQCLLDGYRHPISSAFFRLENYVDIYCIVDIQYPLVTWIFDPFALIIDELSQWQSVRSHNRPALAIAQVTRLRLNKVLSEWRFETTNYVMANSNNSL